MSVISPEELRRREKNLRSIRTATSIRLEKLGFAQVEKPTIFKSMPEDITKLNNKILARYFQHYVEWSAYAGDRLALARVSSLLAEYSVEISILMAMRGLEGGVMANKQQGQRHPSVRKAKLKLKSAESMVLVLESQFNRFDSYYKLISREQTRRQQQVV